MLTNQHHHDYRILNAAKIKIKFQSRKRSNQKFFTGTYSAGLLPVCVSSVRSR